MCSKIYPVICVWSLLMSILLKNNLIKYKWLQFCNRGYGDSLKASITISKFKEISGITHISDLVLLHNCFTFITIPDQYKYCSQFGFNLFGCVPDILELVLLGCCSLSIGSVHSYRFVEGS
jgi:hypothetical protein